MFWEGPVLVCVVMNESLENAEEYWMGICYHWFFSGRGLKMEESCLLEKLAIAPALVCEILSYLTLREIYILENCSQRFKILLASVRFWERKICKEYKWYTQHLEDSRLPSPRRAYWELRYLGHICQLEVDCSSRCRNCFKKTECVLLRICDSCRPMD